MYKFLLVFLCLVNADVFASDRDNEALDNIYRLFLAKKVDVEEVRKHYHETVIHVGRKDTSLLIGREAFMATNIEPLAAMVNSGQMSLTGKMYIVRRVIEGNMANDVGYLYSEVGTPDGKSIHQVQKFSWVFLKGEQGWQVVTDFDATPAPLDVLKGIEPQRVIFPLPD
jgi:hypothetical protein